MGAGAIRAGQAYVEIGANDSKLIAGLNKAAARLKAWGQGVSQVGASLVKLGLAMAAPLALGAKSFMNVEWNMAKAKGITNATAAEFGELNKELTRLILATEYSGGQISEAMAVLARSGLKAGEIIASIGPTLQLATAGTIDLARAADILRAVMGGVGLDTAQLTRAVDVLAAAANAGNHDVAALGSGFAYVASSAAGAGMELESIAAALTVMADAGIRADRGGTTLRALLADLKKVTPEARKTLDELGVKLEDAAGNWRPLADILGELAARTRHLGSHARDAKLATIFDIRSGEGGRVLMNNIEKYVTLTRRLRDAAGEGARMQAVMLDTLTGAWKILTSSVEVLLTNVGRGVAPLLRGWAVSLTGAANAVALMIERNPELFQTLAKVTVAVVAGGAALTALGFVIGGVGAVLGAVAVAFKAVGAALAFAFSPVGLVTAAVVGLGYWLLTSTDAGGRALGWLGGKFGELGAWAGEVIAAIGERWSATWGGIGDSLAAGDLETAWRILWLGLKGEVWRFTGWFETIWIDLTAGFVDTWSQAVTGIAVHVNNVVASIKHAYAWLTTFGDAYQAEYDRIEAERKGVNQMMREDGAREQKGREAAREKRKADITLAVGQNQEEIDALVTKAKESREWADVLNEMEKAGNLSFPEAARKASDAGSLGAAALFRGESAGTFIARAVAGLGARTLNPNERLERQGEEQTKLLREIRDKDNAPRAG